MTHQAVDLIDGDDARLFIGEAVAADGTQHLGVGNRQHDRILFHLVEGEDLRLCLEARREVEVGHPVDKGSPRSFARTQARDFVRQVAGDLLDVRLVAQPAQDIADRLG